MSLNHDQPYIARTLKGDMGAFSVLVDRYKHMVFTLAMRMVKNKEEAEEITQDTFLKVYKGLEGFKGGSKFSTWVYKIAYYRSLDYIKKLGKHSDVSLIEGYIEHDMEVDDHFVDRLEKNEKKIVIKDALKKLSGDDGIVLTLHYFEELSLNEIAIIMNINVNNVKVKLFRARKRLKQVLLNVLEPDIVQSYARK
jgi:RNA polymerase sigma-70 factor (ECF subfamily)